MEDIGEIKREYNETEWEIKDVFTLLKEDEKWYPSPNAVFSNEDSWYLGIKWSGDKNAERDSYIDLCFFIGTHDSEINMDVSFSLKTSNGFKDKESHSTKILEKEGRCEFPQFISKSELLRRASELLPGGVLTVVCKIVSPKSSACERELCTLRTCVSSHNKDNKILEDFKQMFLKQENCDVIIRMKGHQFPAHKNILAARSIVLASTFRIDMKEKETDTVDIEDGDPSIFPDFLGFLYYGDGSIISAENVFSLFTAADKYNVKDLREECMAFMKENLCIDNFCETINIALLHAETELIHLATDFFVANAENIVTTVKWQSFNAENPTQGNELFMKCMASNRWIKS